MQYLATDKKTKETFLYTPPDESGYSICAKVGKCGLYGGRWMEWNAKGELIKSEWCLRRNNQPQRIANEQTRTNHA